MVALSTANVVVPIPGAETASFRATHYGESYTGLPLGCGVGKYSPSDSSIVAIGPIESVDWPCGTHLLITGPAGRLEVVVKDACPGCDDYGTPHFIDLSEAGNLAVCGADYLGRILPHTCLVTVEEY